MHGVPLGVGLSRVSVGPFYQFQSSEDSEGSLTKLVLQICRRIPNLEPDQDVVEAQVKTFRENVANALKEIGNQGKPEGPQAKDDAAINEAAVAKVLEEMKVIVREVSLRSEKLMLEGAERLRPRRSSFRRIHPRMLEEMSHMISRRARDPIGILIVASLVRDDFPWLYELGLEAYRVAKRGNVEQTRNSMEAFWDATEFTIQGSLAEEMELGGKESEGLRELPRAIHQFIQIVEEITPASAH